MTVEDEMEYIKNYFFSQNEGIEKQDIEPYQPFLHQEVPSSNEFTSYLHMLCDCSERAYQVQEDFEWDWTQWSEGQVLVKEETGGEVTSFTNLGEEGKF